MGCMTDCSLCAFPATLVITKYSTARCWISTCSETACARKTSPNFFRVSSSARMAIFASADRMTRRVSTSAALNSSSSRDAVSADGASPPSACPNSPRQYAATRANMK